MAKIYYRRIKSGEITINDVPECWRDEVQALLDADENAYEPGGEEKVEHDIVMVTTDGALAEVTADDPEAGQ